MNEAQKFVMNLASKYPIRELEQKLELVKNMPDDSKAIHVASEVLSPAQMIDFLENLKAEQIERRKKFNVQPYDEGVTEIDEMIERKVKKLEI